jgi:integrase
LKARDEPYWRQIHSGLFIGYRKGKQGTWRIRTLDGGRYRKQKLAIADDTAEADGVSVLSYKQAVRLAMEGIAPERVSGYTVNDAVDDYLSEFEHRAKSYPETKARADKHIRPELGRIEVESLRAPRLRKWLHGMAGDTEGEKHRRSRATANRTLTVLKAALNQAYRDGRVQSDAAWRRVQPFKNADQPKVRHLTHDESVRLVNACEPDFRALVRAALLTGCRYGELTAMQVHDYDPDAATLHVGASKAGPGRHVPLTDEGTKLLDALTAAQRPSHWIFTRGGQYPWGKSQQSARMRAACEQAGIDPPIGFHVLRHTYASMLARQGVPLQVIATALGHADTRMTHRHYAHLQPDHVADQVRAALPDFGGSQTVTQMRGR